MTATTFLLPCFFLLGGLVLGAMSYAVWQRRKAAAGVAVPERWPLVSRVIVTNQEHEVLRWLRSTFPEHMVMVKLPVLRFTTPTATERDDDGKRWQDLLGGVYCTFTVCTGNGNVVGCVDVPGKRGLSEDSRDLKESLLSDCQIAYTVVRAAALPKPSAMRAAFLGEVEPQEKREAEATRGGDSSFHAELDSFTRQKKLAAQEAALRELNKAQAAKQGQPGTPAGFNPDGTGAFGSGKATRPGRFPTQFDDSFIHGDESRPAKLSDF